MIFPVLTPLAVGPGRPFPYISNLSLSLGVLVRDPLSGDRRFARVKVPEVLPRFWPVGEGGRFLPLEQLIAAHLGTLFPGMEIEESSTFRVTRDADLEIDDQSDDLLQAMETELRRRRFGDVVRLEIDARSSPEMREQLIHHLGVTARHVYSIDGLLDCADLTELVSAGPPELLFPEWPGITPPELQPPGEGLEPDIFAILRKGDVLVHHPYERFDTSVEAFVRQAVDDPDVLAIKHTIYRTSGDSPMVPMLIRAAEQGKQAVVLVELKARFDEERNIGWARALERAGVHVVYGFVGLKTHAKCALVVRREGGGIRRYVHIGTGNYHPRTARLYTDFGLLTCRPDLAADVADLFNYLTGFARPRRYRKLLVAPLDLRERILAEVTRVVASHTDELPGHIVMKMNSLVDRAAIEALYAASQAGVRIDLIVRGICCLRPGVPGPVRGHPRRLAARALPRARARLPVHGRRRHAHLHGLGRPHAAQPRCPRRGLHPGRGRPCGGRGRRGADRMPERQPRRLGAAAPTAPGRGSARRGRGAVLGAGRAAGARARGRGARRARPPGGRDRSSASSAAGGCDRAHDRAGRRRRRRLELGAPARLRGRSTTTPPSSTRTR